ncbi:MAG: Na+/H+ antiporter subunit E [Candidatus Thermoplasmatota archaeon]|nr:Na+/H+ antiporter subunit E [Candidatus Thermoplasmatota archaeon]
MRTFAATAVFAFVLYLLFTMGSGDIGFAIGFWSFEELMLGVIVAVITGLAARKLFCASGNMRMANPGRWGLFIAYFFGPFIFAMAKANLDVAYRVITGKIRPGIVRIETGLKNDLEVLMLANSITLTPGTLTVDVDDETNDLFIHWINVEKGQEKKAKVESAKVCGSFPKWARRISR